MCTRTNEIVPSIFFIIAVHMNYLDNAAVTISTRHRQNKSDVIVVIDSVYILYLLVEQNSRKKSLC